MIIVFYVVGLLFSNILFMYLKSVWCWFFVWIGIMFIFLVCLLKYINKRKFFLEIICKMLCLYFERNFVWFELKIVYVYKLKFINKLYGILLLENFIVSLYLWLGKDIWILIKRIFGMFFFSENKFWWYYIYLKKIVNMDFCI